MARLFIVSNTLMIVPSVRSGLLIRSVSICTLSTFHVNINTHDILFVENCFDYEDLACAKVSYGRRALLIVCIHSPTSFCIMSCIGLQVHLCESVSIIVFRSDSFNVLDLFPFKPFHRCADVYNQAFWSSDTALYQRFKNACGVS